MYKIVCLEAASLGKEAPLNDLAEFGECKMYDFTTPEEYFQRVADADIIVVNKLNIGRKQIDAAPRLKLICISATGTNNVDIPYAESKGIVVKNVKGYSTDCVAQVTFSLVLSLVSQIPYFSDTVRSRKYSTGPFFSDVNRYFWQLKGKKYGVIGLGAIGTNVARKAKAFGMDVIYYPTSGKAHSSEFEAADLDSVMKDCDVISIHAPLNDKTRDLIKYDDLKKMKRTAFLVNIGRGGIVNEADLARALNDDLLAGAGIDVFAKEPLPLDSPYFKVKDKYKLIMTPHIGWASVEARTELVRKLVDNVRVFTREHPDGLSY
ncbi:MAG: D-2-hydroxyacid dehydrogenase [Bacteroidales bacterium]|jgi:glycerate dehydrogenase|nr:D-2-hydroxyacid dehydrogenase [Bacteroidales bacterium]